MKRGKQVTLGDALQRLASGLNSRSGGMLVQTSAARAWASICGQTVLAHTTGFFLRNGEAVVYVDSNVWAAELAALSGQYMARINEALGTEAVSSMRFVVSKRVAQDKAFEAEDRRLEQGPEEDLTQIVPLSEAEIAQIRAAASMVKDDELREAAVRATKADLEWKKGKEAANKRDRPRQGL